MQNNVDVRKDEEKIAAIRAPDNLPEVLGQVSKTECATTLGDSPQD